MEEGQSLKVYLSKFLDAGFGLAITKDAHLSQTVAVIDSQKKLTIHDLSCFEKQLPHRDIIRDMAALTQLGSGIQLVSPEQKGVVHAIR
jgi:hypothetical protein